MPNLTAAGIILAAGKGTRMKSEQPKGLHQVAGLPMVELVARAMRGAGIQRIVIVIGHGGELIQQALGDGYEYAWQREQLGTGHAVLMTRDLLKGHDGPVVIAPGDAPLLTSDVFAELLAGHQDSVCTLATAVLDDPTGYGRVVRDSAGKVVRIVEQKDATPEQRSVREVNTSLYCVNASDLFAALPQLKNTNSQGEYYLTDMVGGFAAQGKKVAAKPFDDPSILVGVNDRWQLAQAEKSLRLSILRRHALAGVTLIDPDSTFIGPDVEIGIDATILAGTQLLGQSRVGCRSRIGPNTIVRDTAIGDDTTITMSHVDRSEVGNNVWVGPFANLRPGTKLMDEVKVGDFVELKNSTIHAGAKVPHLSYVGDAEVGARTNIGAGTITVNYDGYGKYRTKIGEDAFIGSNSTLIAPRTIGDRAFVVAGSVITHDVPADAGAFGRAKQENKDQWAAKWRRMRQSRT